MAFLKVIKSRSYFKRFQVKYRRRREGKTDYYARRRLVFQAKNKYASPKYRLVVRFTNRDVVAQIISSRIEGDYVFTAAYGHELTRYGIPVGHTNYAAVYAVGLLLARRLLKKIGLADKYVGNTAVNGEDFNVEPLNDGPRPFKAALDVGLRRTTTGARLFAVVKGACDGGLNIPHSETRFAGYDEEGKKLDAAVLRKYIFGGHVADYMRHLKDEDETAYNTRFSRFIKSKITADGLEAMYAKAHKAIRDSPESQKKVAKEVKTHKYVPQKKLTLRERQSRVEEKIKKLTASKAAAAEEEEEDDDEEADE